MGDSDKPSTDRSLPSRAFAYVRANPEWILLAFVFIVYFITRTIHLKTAVMFSDESHYVRWAQLARSGNPWYSLTFDGKPPLHAWSMVPFLSLFKDPLVAGRMASVFFGAATAVGMVLLGRELADLKLGALAALMYVIAPWALLYDRTVEAEGLLLALFVFAIFFAVRAAKTGKLAWLAGTAVAVGLALLVKGTALLLYPIVPFAYLVKEPARTRPGNKLKLWQWLVGSVGALVVGYGISLLPHLSPAWSKRSHFISGRTKSVGEALRTLGDFPRYLGNIFSSFWHLLTPVFFILCMAGLVLALLLRWRPSYFLWVWLAIATGIICLISKNFWDRFYLVLLPPVLIGGAFAVYTFARFVAKVVAEKRQSWRKVTALSLLGALLVALLVVVPVSVKAAKPIDYRLVPGGNYLGMDTTRTVNYLERRTGAGPVEVLTASRDKGFLSRTLLMYLAGNKKVKLTDLDHPIAAGPIPPPRSTSLAAVLDKNSAQIEKALATGRPVYLLADSISSTGALDGWSVDVVDRYAYPKSTELDITTVNPAPTENAKTYLLRVNGKAGGSPP